MQKIRSPVQRVNDPTSVTFAIATVGGAQGQTRPAAQDTLPGRFAGDGTIGGERLLSPAVIADAIREHWDDMDRMTNRQFRFGCGFMLSCPPFPFGGRRDNFGHTGIGGAVGFGDPDARLGFSYCGNRMAPIADMGPFATPLVDAMYAALK